MKIDRFIRTYGTSEERQELINLLSSELSVIQGNGWSYKAYVFGSMVNSTIPCPDDIDCLLSILLPSGESWSPKNNSNRLDIWPRYIKYNSIYGSGCLSADEITKAFTECNRKTEENIIVTTSECIEISI